MQEMEMQEMVLSLLNMLPLGVILIVIGFFAMIPSVINEVERGFSLVAVIMSWSFIIFGVLIVSNSLFDTTFITVSESEDFKFHSAFYTHLLLPIAILTIVSAGIGIIMGRRKLKKAEQA